MEVTPRYRSNSSDDGEGGAIKRLTNRPATPARKIAPIHRWIVHAIPKVRWSVKKYRLYHTAGTANANMRSRTGRFVVGRSQRRRASASSPAISTQGKHR